MDGKLSDRCFKPPAGSHTGNLLFAASSPAPLVAEHATAKGL